MGETNFRIKKFSKDLKIEKNSSKYNKLINIINNKTNQSVEFEKNILLVKVSV